MLRLSHRFLTKNVDLITNGVLRNVSTTQHITPDLDLKYLTDLTNKPEIESNIKIRKGIGDIDLIHQLHQQISQENDPKTLDNLKVRLGTEALKLPNRTHPDVIPYGDEPKVVRLVGTKPNFSKSGVSKLYEFQDIVKRMRLVRTDQLGSLCGSKSYYILGELAELEQALVRFFVSRLISQGGFELISVPDILPRHVIEGCGMNTRGDRAQVYSLDPALHDPNLCLSGTSEMALAGYLAGKTLSRVPVKLAAVSRCYRAETSNLTEERGIYRVHEFTKVEMFVVCAPEGSEQMLEDICSIQQANFEALGLHFKVLDMPPHELGAPAYRKYDIEAWLPARGIYGEISSCSNCLDYQSRRLGIRFLSGDFVHTLNGTACAIPRLLIALIEMGQMKNGTIRIPEVLRGYMGGKEFIGKQKRIPELKLIKGVRLRK